MVVLMSACLIRTCRTAGMNHSSPSSLSRPCGSQDGFNPTRLCIDDDVRLFADLADNVADRRYPATAKLNYPALAVGPGCREQEFRKVRGDRQQPILSSDGFNQSGFICSKERER